MNICFDWDGTLAKKDVAKEASIRRSKNLGELYDEDWLDDAMKDDSHFDRNKKLIEEYIGLEDEGLQTQIMTNLFQFHYLGVVQDMGKESLFTGIESLLNDLAKEHNLYVTTTLRQDIVKPSIDNLSLDQYFTDVLGNDAKLSYSKKDILHSIDKPIHYMVGDKPSDMEAGKAVDAEPILVTWGTHQTYDDSKEVDTVKELRNLLP